MPADPNRVILTRKKPVHPTKPDRRRPEHDECQLLAHHHLPGRSGACSLSQQRADREPLAYLLRQHRDGAMAAVYGPGDAQRRDGRCRNPSARCSILEIRRPSPFLDGECGSARRGDCADLVSDRRSVADPHAAQCGARASLRSVHIADPRSRRALDPERRRSNRPAVAKRARRKTLQHMRVGVLRKPDRSPLERLQAEWNRDGMMGSGCALPIRRQRARSKPLGWVERSETHRAR